MPSNSTVFVDTHVLVHADDESDKARHARARQWLETLWRLRAGRLSTQVLGDYYVTVTQKLRPGLTQGDARAKVRRFQLWQPWQVDAQTMEAAWGIEARFKLSYWDSLIVASAAQSGCNHVLSEHLQHEQQIDAVQILNPFLTTPEQVFE